jgi:NAD(P)-dependent dehydrogenase (short-subunit alcohol dehydrogenase family)
MNVPKFEKTVDGFETTLAANHLGHFLLTILLIPILKSSAPARIINLSSFVAKEGIPTKLKNFLIPCQGHINFSDLNTENPYDQWKAYTQSKLANILFTNELARKLEGTRVTVNAGKFISSSPYTSLVNPGFVQTDLLKTSSSKITVAAKLIAKSPDKGAQTSLFCAVAPELDNVTGKYFSDCKVGTTNQER